MAMVRVINGSFAFIVAFIRVVLRFQICSNAMSCDATAKRLESSKKVPYLTDLAVRANYLIEPWCRCTTSSEWVAEPG